MIKFDYHTHSSHSPDSQTDMEDMVRRAIRRGLTEYAITDHIDFGYPNGEIISVYSIAENMQAMQAVAAKYASKIKVLAGVELSLRPDVAAITQDIVDTHDFDFVIGSTHDKQGIDFFWPEFRQNRSKNEAYALYYEHMLDTVRTCDAYDVLGHFDYIKRLGKIVYNDISDSDNREIIDEILKTVIAKGKGIEINTAGISYGIGHVHPHINILRRYVQLGGEIITVGSDAHNPQRIAQHFDTAHEMLQQLGVKYITRFDKRKPHFVKI